MVLPLAKQQDWDPIAESRPRPLCRWCRTEVPRGRRAWCSNVCTDLYARVWDWKALRDYVKARESLTCQRCGTTDPPLPEKRHRWSFSRYDPWDVDHIIRVIDGGTDDPDNLRLLCIACHVEVGYEQRGTECLGVAQIDMDLR